MNGHSILQRAFSAVTALLLLAVFFVTPAAAAPPELNINSDAYVVIDAASGQVLVEKNMTKRKAPASITKILTLALALEKGNMDDQITVSKEAVNSIEPGSTHIALVPGEIVTFRDAVMGTQLISANDAANVVAEYTAGSMASFVTQMNLKVEELGLRDSHFINPNGLDANGHYVTAYDMAQITRYALTIPAFREVFAATQYQMPATNIKARDWEFLAQDAIMFPGNREYYEGVTGSKLGYTYNANHTLVASAKRGGMELIVVALDSNGSAAKYNDAKALLDYCFARYESMTISSRELRADDVPLANRETPTGMVSVFSEADHAFAVPLGTTRSSLEIRYNLPELYKSERRVDPSFSVYSADGKLLYTALLSYKILPPPQNAVGTPTQRVPKGDYFNDLMMVAFKCLLVVLGVLALVFMAARCFIMLRYTLQKRAALRRKQELLRRKEQAVARSRQELRNMELAAAILEQRENHPAIGNRPVPDNVTHIYPGQNRMVNKPRTQRKTDMRK